jgi:hypothetical protein
MVCAQCINIFVVIHKRKNWTQLMHSYYAIFIFSFEHAIFKDIFSMFLLHFWIYVDLCLQTCIPFNFFLQRLFFHFCFIHEYFTCIFTWTQIIVYFSIFTKECNSKGGGEKKLYDLTNFMNLENQSAKIYKTKYSHFSLLPIVKKCK